MKANIQSFKNKKTEPCQVLIRRAKGHLVALVKEIKGESYDTGVCQADAYCILQVLFFQWREPYQLL